MAGRGSSSRTQAGKQKESIGAIFVCPGLLVLIGGITIAQVGRHVRYGWILGIVIGERDKIFLDIRERIGNIMGNEAGGSFSGRTAGSGPANRGSSPFPPARL